MKKLCLYPILLFLIIGISLAVVNNITEFDDGCNECNITTNTTKYITIPLNATIIEANISIKGLLGFNNYYPQETENSSTCDPNVQNCANGHDGDYTTYTSRNGSGATVYINETYIIPSNISSAILEAEFDAFLYGPIYIQYYDPSNNTWVDFHSAVNHLNNYTIPSNALTNSTLQINIPVVRNLIGSILLYKESKVWWGNQTYSLNFKLQTNGTTIFNLTSNFTTTNASIQLNKTLIQNFTRTSQQVPINFSANVWGQVEIYNLTITYNKSNSAILTITSPSQIIATAEQGSSVTYGINVTNTGDWNATNFTFESISSEFTPNLNDSITSDCENVNLGNGSSIICNVTIGNIQQSAESDEKLRVRTIGTDLNGIILSTSIDLDITMILAATGGGGGSSAGDKKIFRIVTQNGISEETRQLLIAPEAKKRYCLDVISYNTTQSQVVSISCALPSSPKRPDICQWVVFDRTTIILQPSEEIRETICMDITPAKDILLGEQFVFIVHGISDQSHAIPQDHTITLWVSDYSHFFDNYLNFTFSDSLMQQTYQYIKANWKSDIQELGFSLPNFLYPPILLNQVLFFVIIYMMIKKPTSLTIIASQILFYLFASIGYLLDPSLVFIISILEIISIVFIKIGLKK